MVVMELLVNIWVREYCSASYPHLIQGVAIRVSDLASVSPELIVICEPLVDSLTPGKVWVLVDLVPQLAAQLALNVGACVLVSNGGGDGEDDHHKCDCSVACNC